MSPGASATRALDILTTLAPDPGVIAASAAVVLGLSLIGAALLRRAEPAVAFAAGMGGLVLMQTALGVAGQDLRLGLGLTLALALAAARNRAWLHDWGRPLALTGLAVLPLLLVLSDRRGSEWDEFSHWLHAFRYLAAHDLLPGGTDRPPIASCCAAYPYAWPMLGHAVMRITGYSEAVPVMLNLLILALFGLLLADTARAEAGGRRTGVMLCCAGVLAATLAAPAFVHKLAFSAYADIVTAFLVGTLVVLADRIATPGARRGDVMRAAIGFGLAGAALLAVKPGNAALFGCVVGGLAVLTLRLGGLAAWRAPWWLATVLPPVLILALWRWHVGQSLAGQEMGVRALATWNLAEIPAILARMADVASQKGGHFVLGLAVTALGVAGLARCRDRLDRLALLAACLFVGYNLFLLFTYVAVFGRTDALNVVSFWRYNTHLGLALLVPAAVVAGRAAARWHHPGLLRGLGAVAMIAVLAAPPALVAMVRFDRDPMKIHLRQSLRQAMDLVPPGSTVAVADPHGSGLSRVMATYEWDDRLKLEAALSAFDPDEPAAWLEARRSDWAFIASGLPRLGLGTETATALAHREDGVWRVVARYPYPGDGVPAPFP